MHTYTVISCSYDGTSPNNPNPVQRKSARLCFNQTRSKRGAAVQGTAASQNGPNFQQFNFFTGGSNGNN